MKKCLKKRNSGFTILEVVTVLAILGIISALAVSTISINIDNTKRDEQLTVLKAHLRYAQARAMNSDSNWGITFDTTNKYWLSKGDDQNTKIRLPGEKKVEDEDKSVTMSDLSIDLNSIPITPTGEKFVAFNTLGSPVVVDAEGKSVTAEITIETSGKDITITANTGFIYLIDQ